jgi:hypothetical protein
MIGGAEGTTEKTLPRCPRSAVGTSLSFASTNRFAVLALMALRRILSARPTDRLDLDQGHFDPRLTDLTLPYAYNNRDAYNNRGAIADIAVRMLAANQILPSLERPPGKRPPGKRPLGKLSPVQSDSGKRFSCRSPPALAVTLEGRWRPAYQGAGVLRR